MTQLKFWVVARDIVVRNASGTLLLSIERGIATITLNRPQVVNALDTRLNEELHQAVTKLEDDKGVRVVVIHGAGERGFSAGADLKERSAMSAEERWKSTIKLARTFDAIAAMRVPVIAAVHGFVLAAGCELVLACDIRIAAEGAIFGLPETSIGIFPGAGGTVRLPRLIGEGKAKELIFTARRIDADEAVRLGLVQRVVPRSELLSEAHRIAQDISNNAPLAIESAKKLINHGIEVHISEALELSHFLHRPLDFSEDYAEGLIAFVEKRKPRFTGR